MIEEAYAWHANGDLCLGSECGTVDAGGDHPNDLTTDELGAVWAAVTQALPKAGWLHEDGRWVIPTGTWSITVIHVESGDGYFEPVEEGYKTFATVEPGLTVRGDLAADVPGALRVLGTALKGVVR